MENRTVIVKGKRRIVIVESASGIDKSKEAVLKVMGQGWEYKEEKNKAT